MNPISTERGLSVDKSGVIYVATDLSNNKQYVGQTVDFNKRMKAHRYLSKRSGISLFHRALKKRGVGGFVIVRFNYPIDELDYWEQFWISKLNTIFPDGYNLTIGGKSLRGPNHPWYGHKHSEETKKTMHVVKSEEHKRKISKALKGRIVSEETRKRESISQLRRRALHPNSGAMRGKKHTPEARVKMSLARMGKKRGPYTKNAQNSRCH